MSARALGNLALFVVGLFLLFPLQAAGDARRPRLPSSLLYTPDRRLMKVIACGHGPTLADLVWLQSTNYVISEFKSGKTQIEHLYALYDVMTELDPDFVDAYVAGAVFLSSVADDPDRALELLEKGHGRVDERGGAIAHVTSGRIHPDNKDRWKPLGETAATHLVSLAGFAPTLEERYVEVNLAGRLYRWGATRYTVDRYPDRPVWWETMGPALAKVQPRTSSRGGWLFAVLQVWDQRLHFTPRSSPLHELYSRRKNEIVARQKFEAVQGDFEAWKARHAASQPPPELLERLRQADPLGVGFFVVEGKLVAPALDAAVLERQLARDAAAFRRRHDRAPLSLDELRTFEAKEGVVRPAPPWAEVSWDDKAKAARVRGVPPG